MTTQANIRLTRVVLKAGAKHKLPNKELVYGPCLIDVTDDEMRAFGDKFAQPGPHDTGPAIKVSNKEEIEAAKEEAEIAELLAKVKTKKKRAKPKRQPVKKATK